MQLRPYQRELADRVRAEYRAGARAVLMQLGTGGGKTATASSIIAASVAKGRRVIFTAHLDTLIDDTSERLTAAGIEHGIVQADRPTNGAAPVQVCSLATLHRRGERPHADFVIVDEAHRAAAPSVRAVLEAYPAARLLGLSATPARGDDAPLGDVFDRLVCGPSVRELTAQGFLVPAEVLSPPAPVEGALALDPVEAYQRHAPGRPAMIFARDTEHAEDVASRLSAAGALVAVVLGDTPRAARRQARQRLAAGEPLVLVGCGVFVEGWDSPEVEAIVLGRAFESCGAYLQAVGRGLRPSQGKRRCLVLDLSGAAVLHGLPADDRVWSLEGAAVRRTGDGLAALARCRACFAIFHAGPAQCPQCGELTKGVRLPRRATRIERQELARLDTRPAAERDARALKIIERRLHASGRFPAWRVPTIARSIFERSRKREPPEAA
jgi:superfamily II DNA or RNA helicase